MKKHMHTWSKHKKYWWWDVCRCGRVKVVSGMYHHYWYYGWLKDWEERINR